MELVKIEKLLQKYDEGKTSISEENILREYFMQEEVPDHLISHQNIFNYTRSQREINFEKSLPATSKKKKLYLIGVAASIILALGVVVFQDFDDTNSLQEEGLGTIEDPEQAYQEAKNTLELISNVLNDSRENLGYINEFNKTKNEFLKDQ